MTFNASSNRKMTVLPVGLIVVGGLLFIGWIIAMYITGIVVDEQKIDPADSPLPVLWLGFFGGPVVAAVGAGWLRKRRKG
ncbi:hypothetical protein ACIPY2_00090 [Paenarthrobacter sp. NPDC089675]|uniref:hypothetical protein n=1 Tax=Paenarthrobacter sp. NPDC089675 TaxID=3364376 RepID=UPI003822ECA1